MMWMGSRHARQHEPGDQSVTQKRKKQHEQPRQLHPVIGGTDAATRANGLLRQDLETAMLAVHLARFSSPERHSSPMCEGYICVL